MVTAFIIFIFFIGVSMSSAEILASTDTFQAQAAPPVNVQFHNQDSLGQYSYGYSNGEAAKHESRSLDGVTRGSYSYVDANGELQSVIYQADAENGFRVAATNLPISPSIVHHPEAKTDPEAPAPQPSGNNDAISTKLIPSNIGDFPTNNAIQSGNTKQQQPNKPDASEKSDQSEAFNENALTKSSTTIVRSANDNKAYSRENDFTRLFHPSSRNYFAYSPAATKPLKHIMRRRPMMAIVPRFSYRNYNQIGLLPPYQQEEIYPIINPPVMVPYDVYPGLVPLLNFRTASVYDNKASESRFNREAEFQNDYIYGYSNSYAEEIAKRSDELRAF